MKKNVMKNTMTASLALMSGCMILAGSNVLAANTAFTSSTKNTAKLTIQELDYDLADSYEAIELDFLSRINVKNTASVTVKDGADKSYKASIQEADSDDLSLNVTGLKAGKNYTVTINGIKKSTSAKYGTLTVRFSIPKKAVVVKDVEYDAEDREVTFDFQNNVSYKNAKVTITNQSGTKTYSSTIVEKDADELTVRVNGLKSGGTYQYKITGVQSPNSTESKTLTGTFTAIDND